MYRIIRKLQEWDFGGRFSVQKLLVQTPDGREGEFFLRSGGDFAIIVPLLNSETLVMVEQPRLGLDKPSLEFPMGQVAGKHGEDIALIELKEETGYTPRRLTHLQSSYPSPGWSTQRALIYLAEDLEEGTPEPEPMELITVKNVPMAELEEKIRAGEIYSLHTIGAYFLLKQHLAEKMR